MRLWDPETEGTWDCGTPGLWDLGIYSFMSHSESHSDGWLVGCWLGDSTTSHLVLFISIDVEKVVGGCFWISASALVLFWPWILNLTMTMGHDQDPSLTKSIFQDSKYQDTNVGYFWLKSCPKKIVCEGLLTKGNSQSKKKVWNFTLFRRGGRGPDKKCEISHFFWNENFPNP